MCPSSATYIMSTSSGAVQPVFLAYHRQHWYTVSKCWWDQGERLCPTSSILILFANRSFSVSVCSPCECAESHFAQLCVWEGEKKKRHSKWMRDLCCSSSPCRCIQTLALVKLWNTDYVSHVLIVTVHVTVLFTVSGWYLHGSVIQVRDLSKSELEPWW